MNRRFIYWSAQITGWLGYVLLAAVSSKLNGQNINFSMVLAFGSVLVFGIFISHMYKCTAIKLGWLNISIEQLIPRVVLGSILFAIPFYGLYAGSLYFIDYSKLDFSVNSILEHILTWSILLFIWSLFYFSFHFFTNFRREEIKNLEWAATNNEMELNQLKSQLNPHFIFNSMNTIKALVDEDPKKSKENITKLARILRSTLLTNKQKLITLEEELKLVKDYLHLEQSRFEERLSTMFNIDPETLKMSIPPMMLQTLVENAIKHGISKLPNGGMVSITSQVIDGQLQLEIQNNGVYQQNTTGSSKGIGIRGTVKRLEILYGRQGQFKIFNSNQMVITQLKIPQNLNNEN